MSSVFSAISKRMFRIGSAMLPRLYVFLLVVAVATSSAASAPAADFDTANKLYEQGKYAEAAQAYEKLIQSGQVSAAIYYNLGNAYFKGGQIGRAIAAYDEARRLAPRDPDLQANLQFARNQVQGPTVSPDWRQRWFGRFTLNEWVLAAAGGLWVCLLLLAAQQFQPNWKARLRNWIVVFAVLTLFLGGVCATAFEQSRGATAIVIAQDTAVRQGPLNESPTAFMVHDGAELKVLDRKDEWLQVSTDPRRFGWLRKDQVVVR